MREVQTQLSKFMINPTSTKTTQAWNLRLGDTQKIDKQEMEY